MHIGATFRSRGQRYTCGGSFKHFVPERLVTVWELESKCPECGVTFECTATVSAIHKAQLRRRCPDCRQPGVRVGAVKNAKPSSARKSKGKRKSRRRPIDARSGIYGAASKAQASPGHKQSAQRAAPAVGPPSTGRALATAVASPEGVAAPSPAASSIAAVIDNYAAVLGFLDD
jgi:hypothetical protein